MNDACKHLSSTNMKQNRACVGVYLQCVRMGKARAVLCVRNIVCITCVCLDEAPAVICQYHLSCACA